MGAPDMGTTTTPECFWEDKIYGESRQVMRWPVESVVSYCMRFKHSRIGATEPMVSVSSEVPAESGSRFAGKKVLELGCGTGNNIGFLLQEGFDAIGVDYSRTAIQLAQKQLSEEVNKVVRLTAAEQGERLRVGDVSSLQFADNSFDLIIDRHCLAHCPELLQKALRECHRVLKPGGRMFSVMWSQQHDAWTKNRGEGLYDGVTGFAHIKEPSHLSGVGPCFFVDDEASPFTKEGLFTVDYTEAHVSYLSFHDANATEKSASLHVSAVVTK